MARLKKHDFKIGDKVELTVSQIEANVFLKDTHLTTLYITDIKGNKIIVESSQYDGYPQEIYSSRYLKKEGK